MDTGIRILNNPILSPSPCGWDSSTNPSRIYGDRWDWEMRQANREAFLKTFKYYQGPFRHSKTIPLSNHILLPTESKIKLMKYCMFGLMVPRLMENTISNVPCD